MAVKKIANKPTKKELNTISPLLNKIKAIPEKQTKNQILNAIAEETGLSKEAVSTVFESLAKRIMSHMVKKGSGEFTIPEAGIRIKRKTRPATKKRIGRNPATGEQIVIPAKPARTVVKIIPLRILKESVN